MSSKAQSQVLVLPELLEKTLAFLTPSDLHSNAQRVNKTFECVIRDSPTLRKKLHLKADFQRDGTDSLIGRELPFLIPGIDFVRYETAPNRSHVEDVLFAPANYIPENRLVVCQVNPDAITWIRPSASCCDIFIVQPPIKRMTARTWCIALDVEYEEEQELYSESGITVGMMIDAVQRMTSEIEEQGGGEICDFEFTVTV